MESVFFGADFYERNSLYLELIILENSFLKIRLHM
jgi:hypothetical protein